MYIHPSFSINIQSVILLTNHTNATFKKFVKTLLKQTFFFIRISVVKEDGSKVQLKVSSGFLPSQILQLCKVHIEKIIRVFYKLIPNFKF